MDQSALHKWTDSRPAKQTQARSTDQPSPKRTCSAGPGIQRVAHTSKHVSNVLGTHSAQMLRHVTLTWHDASSSDVAVHIIG
ncbi:hypothetical protein LIER_33826 [Lithospermum erythrorhizon]|uniref:Uncharacterized protein n=1 Tax=Lithospermum erythrorhizon TaxID=34254 RepID=A0AAV3RXS3_LITER